MSSPYRSYLQETIRTSSNEELRELNDIMATRVSPSASAYKSPTADVTYTERVSPTYGDAVDFMRPPASRVPQSNSRAVISALKALQEKIKKLEADKAYYEDNASALEREKESYKQLLGAERTKSSLASAEKELELQREKANVESRLTVTQTKVSQLQTDLVTANDQLTRMEMEKRQAEMRAQEAATRASEAQKKAQDTSFSATQRMAELEIQQQRMQHEMQAQMREMQRTMAEERAQRRAAEEQNRKTKTTLEEVLSVNNTLLEKVTHRPGTAPPARRPASAAPSNLRQTAKRAGTISRRSSSRENSMVAGAGRPRRSVKIADGITATKKVSIKGGRRMPFVVGKSAGPSFAIGANVQQALSMLQDYEIEEETPADGVVLVPFNSVDIDIVITSLEGEYGVLHERYENLLQEMRESDPGDTEDVHAILSDTVQAIESKAEQINKLKRYRRSVQQKVQKTHTQLERYRRLLEEETRNKATPYQILRGIQELQRALRADEVM